MTVTEPGTLLKLRDDLGATLYVYTDYVVAVHEIYVNELPQIVVQLNTTLDGYGRAYVNLDVVTGEMLMRACASEALDLTVVE